MQDYTFPSKLVNINIAYILRWSIQRSIKMFEYRRTDRKDAHPYTNGTTDKGEFQILRVTLTQAFC